VRKRSKRRRDPEQWGDAFWADGTVVRASQGFGFPNESVIKKKKKKRKTLVVYKKGEVEIADKKQKPMTYR